METFPFHKAVRAINPVKWIVMACTLMLIVDLVAIAVIAPSATDIERVVCIIQGGSYWNDYQACMFYDYWGNEGPFQSEPISIKPIRESERKH